MVGAKGFEPSTLWSQTRCATRLRYAPTPSILTRYLAHFWGQCMRNSKWLGVFALNRAHRGAELAAQRAGARLRSRSSHCHAVGALVDGVATGAVYIVVTP